MFGSYYTVAKVFSAELCIDFMIFNICHDWSKKSSLVLGNEDVVWALQFSWNTAAALMDFRWVLATQLSFLIE